MGKKLEKLLSQAQPHLQPGEQSLGAVLGLAESKLFHQSVPRMGALIATNGRIVLYVKKLGGHEMASINYTSVTSVETGKTVGGHNFTVHSSENDIHIRGIVDGDPNALAALIRQRTQGGQPQATAAPTASAADELTKLAALLNQGLITREQYDQQAARLLQ
ncbi:hypothetical protein GCM10027447_12530 [Glycomyces halotolerans]